jgi:hypothetical protein
MICGTSDPAHNSIETLAPERAFNLELKMYYSPFNHGLFIFIFDLRIIENHPLIVIK